MYAEAVSAKLGRAPFRNAEKERLAIAGAGHHNLALTRGQWTLVRYLPALMSPPTDAARETIAEAHDATEDTPRGRHGER